MILDDLELNPDKYKNKKLSDLTDGEDFDEEKSVQYAKGTYKKSTLPMMILVSIFFGTLSASLMMHLLTLLTQIRRISV